MAKIEWPLITVLTPTYNRAQLLNECYKSLERQSNHDFLWMIVDDGSTDNTKQIVDSFVEKAEFTVLYFAKLNGGKHTAINFAEKKIQSALTLILDSDDKLTADAIEQVKDLHLKSLEEKNICGYTFLKKYPDGRLMGDSFPKEGRYNFIDWRVNGVVSGDQCDVFFTECLKEYPFSEYEGERFIGESTAWIKMASKYDMICRQQAIYIADYIDGGLTQSGRKLRIQCPQGGMEYANLCMQSRCSFKRAIRSAILYNAYAYILNRSLTETVQNCNNKGLVMICAPIGKLAGWKWTRKHIK